jgi:hypothetical protein
MKDDPTEASEVIAEHGSFLLIRAGSRFAVVERRAGQVYPMAPGERAGETMTPEGIAAAAAEADWMSENKARQLFDELCDRGERLARSLR